LRKSIKSQTIDQTNPTLSSFGQQAGSKDQSLPLDLAKVAPLSTIASLSDRPDSYLIS